VKVVTHPPNPYCGECGDPLTFEQGAYGKKPTEAIRYWPIYCTNVDRFSNITGELLHKGCSRAEKRLAMPLTLVDCEELPA
jgi:hypothetical protein